MGGDGIRKQAGREGTVEWGGRGREVGTHLGAVRPQVVIAQGLDLRRRVGALRVGAAEHAPEVGRPLLAGVAVRDRAGARRRLLLAARQPVRLPLALVLAAAVAILAVLAEGTGFLEGMGHVRRPLKRGVSGWKGKAFEKRNSAEKEQREMRDLGVLFASVPCQCGVAPIVPFATCSGNFESIAYRVVRFMYVTVYIASKMRDVSFDKSLRCQPKI